MSEPGPLVGTGRAADVYDIGNGRVLRRYRTDHDSTIEAAGMRAAWTAGYPVPEVFAAKGRDLVMERLDGPTMLKALGDRPWRFGRIADQLAELHTRLAGLEIDGRLLPARFEPAECLVHLDLHPGNVVLTSRGPVVIDWSNAGMGPRGADVATTSSSDDAGIYAALWLDSWLYLVTPVGVVAPDPDAVGPSLVKHVRCSSAVIVHRQRLPTWIVDEVRAQAIDSPLARRAPGSQRWTPSADDWNRLGPPTLGNLIAG